MVADKAVPETPSAEISITTILTKLQPRLAGFVAGVELNPKCKHDWEAHRVRSSEVKFVFARLDARTLTRAAEAGRLIREETTTAICIRKIGDPV